MDKKIIRLKIDYDSNGAYVIYNDEKFYINAVQKDYGKMKVVEIICEPINTYILCEEVKQ